MKYFKYKFHYYAIRKTDALHVSPRYNIINKLDLDFFYEHKQFDGGELLPATKEEFNNALNEVLNSLQIDKI